MRTLLKDHIVQKCSCFPLLLFLRSLLGKMTPQHLNLASSLWPFSQKKTKKNKIFFSFSLFKAWEIVWWAHHQKFGDPKKLLEKSQFWTFAAHPQIGIKEAFSWSTASLSKSTNEESKAIVQYVVMLYV